MSLLQAEEASAVRAGPDEADEALLFPLSFAQQRLWILDRMEPGTALYNVPAAWRLRGALDRAALAAALGEVVRRHESLRTVFRMVDGEPAQVVLPAAPVSLPLTDLSAVPSSARDALADGRMRDSATGPFDLERGPLFRAGLVRLGEGEHLLLLCMHHVVSDGWSMGVLFGEIAALYGAFERGEPSPLAEPAIQYGDYAAWQREHVAGERLERQVAWWSERLAGAPILLELPTDRPRPAVRGHRGGLHSFRLPPGLGAGLNALARREGATPYMVLLAAFQVLLGKYARQDDVVVGSPIAGRTRPELEGLIGFFVNTIAVRADLSGDPPFRALLGRVREAALGAYAHQEVPFEQLVEALAPERTLSHNPLFQTLFALQNASHGAGLRLAGVEVEPVPSEGVTSKFDLSLVMWEGAAGIGGAVEYAAELFDPETVARMAAHYRVLLAAIVRNPGLRLSALPLLDGEERDAVLGRWSGAGESFPVADSLHGRFEARAALHPRAVALTCDGEPVTYAALNARANRLARRLRALGAGPESRVGLCAERSTDLVAGVLAILKAGAAYVPLDPAYPAERLAYMAADSGVRVVLAQAHLADRVPAGVQRVELDAMLPAESGENLGIGTDPAQLAYVIYTSGSTGRPKGVGVTHANVLRLFAATDAWFGFGAGDVWTLFHSYAFDFSVWEIWGALLYGGRLVVVPWEVSRDPAAFRALLAREGVTVLNQTPSAFRPLIQADLAAGEGEGAGALSLRYVIFGGEALEAGTLRDWVRGHGDERPRLVNMYGITETTVHVTYHPVTAAEVSGVALGSAVGVAIPDLRTYVLDAHGQPLPAGVPGELCVGGAGPARGYLGRPALTAQRFVPDAFSGIPGARLYRSGDLARWTAEGTLEYLGRIDQQVKVRGFRIELGEIEGVLQAHPSVAEAAVVVRGAGDDASLAAYVVPAGDTVDTAELRAALKTHLPEYMVPAAIVAMERLPLTSNGKLDRAALPEPDVAAVDADGGTAPRTLTEELVAGIWAEVLKTDRVGAGDDFFALGGHSLRATQVMARVQEAFGVSVPLRALFESPTVRALAARVDDARRDGSAPPLPPVERAEGEGPRPLSFAQQRLWFLDRMHPGAPWYNVATAFRLAGELDGDALERALAELVRRHETLRTVFALADDEPVQVARPAEGFALERAELGAGDADRGAAVRAWLHAAALRPFDLAAGPLFRAGLLRVEAGEHVLLLAMHHIVSDGWSMGVLFRELGALYGAFARGEPSPLGELAVQYADYAAWQRAHLRGEVLDAQLEWWRAQLAGVPTRLELPTDRPRPPVQGHGGGAHVFHVDEQTARALPALARREGATAFMTLLAAFQAFLSRVSGQAALLVGTPVANRARREVEPLIGFFVNTVALRADLSDDPSFRTLLARVRETSLGAYARQELPFERLVEELKVERDLSRSPLVQVMFALREEGEGEVTLPGVHVQGVPVGTGTARFDLMLTMVQAGERLAGVLEYSTGLFDPATAARMAEHFQVLLRAAVAQPRQRISALPLMAEAERRQVVVDWSATEQHYADAEVGLHRLVERQAARTPRATALVFEGREVDYAELNARANRLARHLRRLGVRAESRVGVCAERSLELVVGLLAVLKTGGAYVPLDPSYPAERLAYVLEDAGVAAILAQERLRGRLPSTAPVVALEDDRSAEDADDLAVEIDPGQLAYVIYTSGSTGRPKGAMNAHRGIVNRLLWMQQAYGLAADDAVLQKTPFGFDVSVWEFFWPLITGARMVIARPEGHRDPAYLASLVERERVTVCHFVPPMLSTFLEGVDAGRCATLRAVVCSGEALPAPLVGRFADRLPAADLYNLYGPTEAAVDVTAWTCGPDDVTRGVPIGRPVANTRTYVVDARGNPAPVGVPGELYLAGVQVGRGYLGRPALTAERFVPDALSGEPGARAYRTGDLARWRADGALQYLGRTDFQVKLRGFRIELGEIEAALARHPGVRESAVVVRGEGDARRLVGYAVAGGVDEQALRGALARELPDHMVPGAIVVLDAFPLTPNGKLDRAALPAPEPAARTQELLPPGTETERAIAEVWREVLGVGEVSVLDNFFSLGGHSLVLARAHRRLGERWPELTLLHLFEHPTIRSLAAHLENGAPAAGLEEGVERANLRNDLRARREQQLLRRRGAARS